MRGDHLPLVAGIETMNDDFKEILTHLHRGGGYGYWWTMPGKTTTWWPADAPATIPDMTKDVYFGIHPTAERKSQNERAQVTDITAVNCLFAEFDAKDFGDSTTQDLEISKEKTLRHIEHLHQKPCVIIDSGGGYHCYWLLKEPFIISDDFSRHRAKTAQANWVQYVGGDSAAKDLARVLRVPGTRNYKPTYPIPPMVQIVKYDRGEQ
jgi:hypothetical protein